VKLTDDQIQKLFGEKLADAQAPVDPAIWSSVQSSLGGAASATGSGLFGSLGWIAGAVAVVAISVVGYVTLKDDGEATNAIPPVTPIEQNTVEIIDQDEVTEEYNDETNSVELAPENKSQITKSTQPESGNSQLVPVSASHTPITPIEKSKDTVVSYEIARGASPIVAADPQESNPVAPSETTVAPQELSAKFSAIRDWQDELVYQLVAEYQEDARFEWSIDGEIINGESIAYSFDEGEHLIQLTVTGTDGSNQTHETPLLVYREPTVLDVNTFTPFGSPGISDLFDLQAVAVNIRITRVVIRDNMNQVVYNSENRMGPWDGTDRFGERCKVTTYTYLYEGVDVYGTAVSGGGRVTINNN
jgi:hypothetical protein